MGRSPHRDGDLYRRDATGPRHARDGHRHQGSGGRRCRTGPGARAHRHLGEPNWRVPPPRARRRRRPTRIRPPRRQVRDRGGGRKLHAAGEGVSAGTQSRGDAGDAGPRRPHAARRDRSRRGAHHRGRLLHRWPGRPATGHRLRGRRAGPHGHRPRRVQPGDRRPAVEAGRGVEPRHRTADQLALPGRRGQCDRRDADCS